MDSDLIAITGVMGGLSIGASLVIIVTYWMYPKLRTDWRRLLVFLSICDVMQGIFYCTWSLVPTAQSVSCYGFSIFGLFFANAAYLWTACVAHQLHRRMAFMLDGNEQFGGQDGWFRVYHTLCWGYPAVVVGICLLFDKYRPCTTSDCFGCFLVTTPGWRIFGLYATLWACWIFTLAMYVRTYFNFRSLVKGIEITPRVGEFIRTFRLKLILVPLLFIVLRLPETLYRVREIVEQGSQELGTDPLGVLLNRLQAFCNPSQGLTNFILFVVATPPVLFYFNRCVFGLACRCPCCPRSHSWDEQTSLLDPVTRPALLGGASMSVEAQSTYQDLSVSGDVYVYSRDDND